MTNQTERPEDTVRRLARELTELESATLTPRVKAQASIIDAFLDKKTSGIYQAQPLAQTWTRVAKIAEEAGEAISELIAATGANPRKGVIEGAYEKMLQEIADVWCTALFALMHFTKDADETERILSESLEKAYQRVQGT